LAQGSIRSAIPAPAKELLRSSGEPLDTDSVSGAAVTAAENRQSRVAELRQQVQDGTYKVDTAEVAGKLIDSHLDE
jgi:flagellar biosynthesis anti-sigma factor FlgM